MKVQPLLSTKVDGLFDLSLCTDDVIFEIINLTAEEIWELLANISDQLFLLEEAEG
jgi:hypothetical protein